MTEATFLKKVMYLYISIYNSRLTAGTGEIKGSLITKHHTGSLA